MINGSKGWDQVLQRRSRETIFDETNEVRCIVGLVLDDDESLSQIINTSVTSYG